MGTFCGGLRFKLFRTPSAARRWRFHAYSWRVDGDRILNFVLSCDGDARERADGLPAGLLIEQEIAYERPQDIFPYDRFQ